MPKQLSNEALKKQLELKLKNLTDKFEKETAWIRAAIQSLSEESDKSLKIDYVKPKSSSNVIKSRISYGGGNLDPSSVMSKINLILKSKNEPLSSTEIMLEMNKLFTKQYDKNSFSGLLSQVYRRPNSPFTKHVIPNADINHRYVYVLKDWLIGSDLKDDYYQKIAKKAQLVEDLWTEVKK